jgi:hypothetical protein
MSDASQTTEWRAAWAKLKTLDGAAWDAESERLEALWRDEYVTAFVRIALTRDWGDAENAKLWALDCVADAFCACRGGDDTPTECAEVDVEVCERESS